MTDSNSITLNQSIQRLTERCPLVVQRDFFLRGLSYLQFFIDKIPVNILKFSYCGTEESLLAVFEGYELRIIGEVNSDKSCIALYEVEMSDSLIHVEHFRTVELLEDHISRRPFVFQRYLFSLRLNQEIGEFNFSDSLSYECVSPLRQDSDDIMDLLTLCLAKQRVPSQILSSQSMPALSADDPVISKMLGEWVFDYRVGTLIDDLIYLKCLPSSIDQWLKDALPGIRWYERNQIAIEKIYLESFKNDDIRRSKALFYLCIVQKAAGSSVLRWNENEIFAVEIDKVRDWWLAKLQGERLDSGLIESWIGRFGYQYKIAIYCSCLLSMRLHEGSPWFDRTVCLSRITELLARCDHEEVHVRAELESYLDGNFHEEQVTTALQESWSGRLKTRKQWMSFLGIN